MVEPFIVIRGLTKSFPTQNGSLEVLKGIDLNIGKGDIYGIIGMSGAGKSTLIRCINHLEKPTAGQIIVDGLDVTSVDARDLIELRRSVGMIFQQFNLLMQSTVEKNVAFPLEIMGVPKSQTKERVDELLSLVGLLDKKHAYPAQLSGGQKQRVAIARALASNPKVLLCDEATSALDPMTTRSILALLASINKELDITIVLITHEMEVIQQICSRVAIIDEGEIAEEGTVTDVFTRPRTDAALRLFRPSVQSGIPKGSHCIRIVFEGSLAHEPVIANLVLTCGAPINILSGDIRRLTNRTYGQLIIELPQSREVAQKALHYLAQQGLTWEEVHEHGSELADNDR